MIKVSPIEEIDHLDAQTFINNYKKKNKPVVIKKLTENWPAQKKWSFEYIKELAGDKQVPLYDCVPSKDRKHQHAPAVTMSLAQYINRLEQGKTDLRLFFYNFLSEIPLLSKDFSYPEIGLKFFKKLPVLFIAGAGTKVQMHFDIDYADIFLCHFGGKKRVMMFSHEQTRYMYHVPFSYSSLHDVDFDSPDYDKYPALKYLQGEVAELHHGDILYIPPGYWHYIVYEEASLSMALRAFPRTPVNFLKMLNNLLIIRTVEGLMRKLVGQSWNNRNERQAVIQTNEAIAKKSTKLI